MNNIASHRAAHTSKQRNRTHGDHEHHRATNTTTSRDRFHFRRMSSLSIEESRTSLLGQPTNHDGPMSSLLQRRRSSVVSSTGSIRTSPVSFREPTKISNHNDGDTNNNNDDDYDDYDDFDGRVIGGFYQDDNDNKGDETHAQLESFDSYIVVSVLTATASFAALFEATPDDETARTPLLSFIHAMFVVLCSISSLSGIYATVVFSFCSIYGRTAVGAGRYGVYKEFRQQTGGIRYRAFLMYLLSLISFLALLVATATERIEKKYRWPFCATLLVLSILSYRDWNHIIQYAAPIFALDNDDDENAENGENELEGTNDDGNVNNNNADGVKKETTQPKLDAATMLARTQSKKII